MPVKQVGEHHVPALLRAEQSAAPDCLQRPLRFRFRQQVSLGVRLHQRRSHPSLWFLRSQGREKESLMRLFTIWLIATLALVILTALLAADAQPAGKVPRIGFLRPSLASPCRTDAFAQGLRELGYVEGHNIVIEWRCADGTVERQQGLAVELVQLPLDVFVAASADGPLAAMQATRTIPIVFVAVIDPVAMGLVTSLAQPGGNVTGVTNQVSLEFHAKRLQLLLEAMPGVTRVAALQQGVFVRAVPARALMQQAAEEAAA
jgi:ABC-type uncharacterized transport system substrate-binding protein